MDYALSNSDIMDLMGSKCKIMTYSDLAQYKSIKDLLTPHGVVFILYESKPGVGHWTVLMKLKGRNAEFFDSYGLSIDQELDYIDPRFKQQSNQTKAHLSRLLLNSGYTIHYNNKQLQALRKNISTCGRWCVCRASNRSIGIDTFAKRIKNLALAEDLTPDELVCQLVQIN